ncbi:MULTISPECIES: hypothetical protein [unclassified Brevundimonas]|uniref:hypothetical protein n=1 Tax=unclassified Brevundimonas TaxID=2622653 RepID=UPI0006F25809|nr:MULTISPECIES: hypothetical protein [unclassified Brevundimonas]KQY66790.1 hypothetical protein ASD25_14745 [Brevundimonas sp. Root1423]KRA22807.1 hypothetical protein ASD59_09250 [Brevundimonas sp. Root608]
MTDFDATAQVVDLAKDIQTVIAASDLEGEAAVICDALQLVAVQAAERAFSNEQIGRNLLLLAERYLSAPGPGADAPKSEVETAHEVLCGTTLFLERLGISRPKVREFMLGFVVSWIGMAEGPQGAGVIYRHADALAGRPMGTVQ